MHCSLLIRSTVAKYGLSRVRRRDPSAPRVPGSPFPIRVTRERHVQSCLLRCREGAGGGRAGAPACPGARPLPGRSGQAPALLADVTALRRSWPHGPGGWESVACPSSDPVRESRPQPEGNPSHSVKPTERDSPPLHAVGAALEQDSEIHGQMPPCDLHIPAMNLERVIQFPL